MVSDSLNSSRASQTHANSMSLNLKRLSGSTKQFFCLESGLRGCHCLFAHGVESSGNSRSESIAVASYCSISGRAGSLAVQRMVEFPGSAGEGGACGSDRVCSWMIGDRGM